MQITLIAAIGRQGQLGLRGALPWGDDFPEDRRRFREKTTGGVLIGGFKTLKPLMHLEGTAGRHLILDEGVHDVSNMMMMLEGLMPGRPVFIIGGAKTYARWIPHCTAFDITVLPYEGEADVFMPSLTWSQP